MLIKSLELHNFRQFYGRQRINFSSDPEKNVTLIHAENGVGKTALLNSILWCLYKKSTPNFTKPTILLNNKAKSEGKHTYSVHLEFEEDGREFSVQRGSDSISGEVFKVYEIFQGNHKEISQNANIFINSIVPKDMADYFFFQGEGVGTMVSTKKGRVPQAVKDIMGFKVAQLALDDLRKIKSEYTKQLKKVDQGGQASEHQLQIQQIHEELIRANKSRSEANQAIDLYTSRIEGYDEKLKRSNHDVVKEKHERRIRLEKQLANAENDKLSLEQSKIDLIREFAYVAFSHQLAKDGLQFIDTQELQGKIPAPYNDQLVKDILESKECICGANIEPGSTANKKIQSLLINATDPLMMHRLTKARAQLTVVRSDSKKAKTRFAEHMSSVSTNDHSIKKFSSDLDSLSIDLQGSSIKDISDIEVSRKRETQKLNEENQRIGRLLTEIEGFEREIKSAREKLSRMEALTGEAKKFSDLIQLTEEIEDTISMQLNQTEKSIVTELQSTINDLLEKFVRQDYRAKVSSNFELKLIDSKGEDIAESDGQALLLSLTFITSLIKIARVRENASGQILTPGAIAPFVIDAPFGVLDNKYKSNIAETIPSSARQVVFLLSSSHWEGTVEEKIRGKIGEEYNMVLEMESIQNKKENDYIEVLGKRLDTVRYTCEHERTIIEKVH